MTYNSQDLGSRHNQDTSIRHTPTCESNTLEISRALTFTSSNCKQNKFLATWTKSEMECTSVGTWHLTSSKYILPFSK